MTSSRKVSLLSHYDPCDHRDHRDHPARRDASQSNNAVATHVNRRKKAPGLADIAREAGVSRSTVDRVMNERGSVSSSARKQVVAAASRLGVRRLLPEVHQRLRHVDVILPINTSPMFQRLNMALQRTMLLLDRNVLIHRITLARNDDAAFAKAIASPPYQRAGLIVVGGAGAHTLHALHTAAARGEKAVTMVTDLENTRYVGMDNWAAGRTAGHMIGKFTRGKGRVIILRGLNGFPATDQRVNGCIDALKKVYPRQTVQFIEEETNDDAQVCYRLLTRILKDGPIGAIYNTGDGSEGIYRALREGGLLGKVAWVAHEMHDAHAKLLALDQINLIIDQNPDAQVLAALQSALMQDTQADAEAKAPSFTDFSLFTMTNVRNAHYLAA